MLTPTSVPAHWTSRGPVRDSHLPQEGGQASVRREDLGASAPLLLAFSRASVSPSVNWAGGGACLKAQGGNPRAGHGTAMPGGVVLAPAPVSVVGIPRQESEGAGGVLGGGAQSEMFFCSVQPGLHT